MTTEESVGVTVTVVPPFDKVVSGEVVWETDVVAVLVLPVGTLVPDEVEVTAEVEDEPEGVGLKL